MTPTEKKPDFHPSVESQTIARHLSTLEVGQLVTYDELCRLVHAADIEEIRMKIQTARGIVQREKNVIFGTVTGIGLKRLSDQEIIHEAEKGMVRIARATRRTAGKLACSNIDSLAPEKRSEALRLQAQLGALELAGSTKAARHIDQQLLQGRRLEIGNVVELFKGRAA
jgi:hypothetical protein